MVLSDLCGSTELSSRDLQAGAALQAAHEALTAIVADKPIESPHFKSLGDGTMIEEADPVTACSIALQLIEASRELRAYASLGQVPAEFNHFVLKVVVASGQFFAAAGTQRWLGLLPTKAARLSAHAIPNEVWIDSGVADVIGPFLDKLNADIDYQPINGAAFNVPFKGFVERTFTIHQLRTRGQATSLRNDELQKELMLTWSDVTAGLKDVVDQVQKARLIPKRVVGIGRSGAIIGGIIAGNLPSARNHLPVDVIERTQPPTGAERVLSTLTEAPECYEGQTLKTADAAAKVAWDPGLVLLAIGEAKTHGSFNSAKAWLRRRSGSRVTPSIRCQLPAMPDHRSRPAERTRWPCRY